MSNIHSVHLNFIAMSSIERDRKQEKDTSCYVVCEVMLSGVSPLMSSIMVGERVK